MIAALRRHVVPALRERGFKGSFPHFRRPKEHAIDLLTFQFDKYGGGFVVELATGSTHGIETSWGEHIPPNKVKAWDASRRLRLGARDEQSDGIWFRYDRIRQQSALLPPVELSDEAR
jgi:hypothetical protein